jgi:hypothetical protein
VQKKEFFMAVIFHVLKEELERLQETETGYSEAIANMPRGTPSYHRRGKSTYLYLQYRDGDHVIQDYVGHQDSEKAKDILEKVAQRLRYEKLLKETKSALKDVKKALRGKI